jgi:integrating conjugative element protein (TIGR03746 family)
MMNIYRGWIANAWKKEDADAQIIKIQKYFITILFLLCSGFFTGWVTAPSRLTVYIPPEIQNGATIKAGTIPEPLIYSFAYEIWQELNYWPSEDGEDYKKNIKTYWPYLTPRFKAELIEDSSVLKESGQIQRIRYLLGLSGAAFDIANVKKLGNDTWEVDLKMRLTEFKNNQPVKDVEIIYPLRITRTNVSPKNNPFGLMLDGYLSEPQRLKTYI